MTIALYIIGAFVLLNVIVWALLRELLPEIAGIFSPFTWRKRQ